VKTRDSASLQAVQSSSCHTPPANMRSGSVDGRVDERTGEQESEELLQRREEPRLSIPALSRRHLHPLTRRLHLLLNPHRRHNLTSVGKRSPISAAKHLAHLVAKSSVDVGVVHQVAVPRLVAGVAGVGFVDVKEGGAKFPSEMADENDGAASTKVDGRSGDAGHASGLLSSGGVREDVGVVAVEGGANSAQHLVSIDFWYAFGVILSELIDDTLYKEDVSSV
jgi:hypothetical protein